MNDMNEPDNKMVEDKDAIAPLIRLAGPRGEVDAARKAAAYRTVAAHWQSQVDVRARRRGRRTIQRLAIAASVVLALALGFVFTQPAGIQPGAIVAEVNRVVGGVLADGQSLERGARLPANAVIETPADGRLVLDLLDGQVMRIDTDSRLVALSAGRFRLDRGAVYVDSADSPPSASVFIETSFGVASDVGTQFQVRVRPAGLLLGVREGLVALERNDEPTLNVTVGRVLEVSRGGETTEREGSGVERIWRWVSEITPLFDIEGETLYSYLNWYAREAGVDLEWTDRNSESRAAAIFLSGTIEGMSLTDGLDLVQRIAPFEYVRHDDILEVRVAD